MLKMKRRTFLKLATATGISAAMMDTLAGNCILFPEAIARANENAPEEVKYSHCVMCNHGPKCGIKAIVKDNQIIRLERRESYPNINICAKGCASIQDLYHPNRLLYPMKRTNPKGSEDPGWERITWDEALATIAEKLNGIKEKYGADKVMFTTGDPKEPRPALQRLAFNFGSPNYGTESSTCSTGTRVAACLNYGTSMLATGSAPTPGKTKVFINWGTNPAWSSPYAFEQLQAAKDAGTKMIMVDPRVTPTVSRLADIHLQIRPGSDAALALCFGNAYIESGAYDHEFVENYAHGFEEYKARCAEYPVAKTAEICGISEESIQAAIDMLLNAGGPITYQFRAAFPHHVNGVGICRAIGALIPLSGSLDVAGGCRVSNTPGLNVDGPFGGNPLTNPESELDKIRVDRKYFPIWAKFINEIQLNKLPEYVRDGDIRAAFMMGQNAMMWPQTKEYQQAFEQMEFTVSADFYLNSWTHHYLDMVLPAAMSFERALPLTISGRNIYLKEPVVKPLGEARPDWRICADVATALGFPDEIFFGGGDDAEEKIIRHQLEQLGAGVTIEDLRAASPEPVNIPVEKKENPEKKYLTGALKFSTPSGKFEFASEVLKEYGFDPVADHVEPTESPISTPDVAVDYPLILNTGSRSPIFTHSKQRNLPWLRNIMPDPVVRLYPTDAEARGIMPGDDVFISTKHGEIKAKAEITVIVKPGSIDMIHGWSQANVNELHARDFDPVSGFPSYKEGLCQVRKA